MPGPASHGQSAFSDTLPGDGPDHGLAVEGLAADVEIVRDIWGVPHIRAGSADDAFFANGFVHAQDRLWQMDAARRRAVGRFAEWAGDSALAMDILSRQMDIENVSRHDFGSLAPETTRMLERYAAGINAFIAREILPIEYQLLDEKPEPWEPWHCVAVMRQRGLLMGSFAFKLWRAAALRTLGPDLIHLLRYDDGGTEKFIVPQGAEGRRWIASVADLAKSIEAMAATLPPDATLGGSNNWAVSGTLTASRKPILAGDPHRIFEIPSMYAQLHVTCDDFDALGLSIPGVPAFPHFAHTERVAWCVTHAFADIHDLYVERFEPGGGERYAVEHGWEKARTRTETLRVRGFGEKTIQVFETRHGPIILGGPEGGFGIALRSMQTEPGDRSLDCLLPMMKARDLPSFYEATRGWGVIDHNLVGADTDGRIGVSIRATVPDRDRANGWLPVCGWNGEHEWRGTIPFEDMPRHINPERGYIVTANNRPVPEDWDYYFSTDCHPSTRAARIEQRLCNLGSVDGEAMISLLRDTQSAIAGEIGARICQAPLDPEGRALVVALEGWNGQMDQGLLAPSVYFLIRQEMTRILARRSGLDATREDPFANVAPGIPAVNQLWWTLPNLLRNDDTRLLGGAAWNDVIAEAVATVARDRPTATWGDLHKPKFSHPLAGVFLERAEALSPSSQTTGGDGDCVCAIGAYPSSGPAATYGSIARYLFDLSDWDACRWVVFHGSSGNPASEHYSDQNALWAQGELAPAPYSRAAVNAHMATRERLTPPQAD